MPLKMSRRHLLANFVPKLLRHTRPNYSTRAVVNMCKGFELTEPQLKRMSALLNAEIEKGLKKDTHTKSTVKCYVTYVQDLPNGREQGKYLALDLGGTNFRVILIELGEFSFEMSHSLYVVPQDIMHGTGEALFDYLATCIAGFVRQRELHNELLPMGFTFSFPLKQTSLTKGILERWTKGFNCTNVEGQDVVELLNKAIKKRRDVHVEVCAILNDTTGTLASCAWLSNSARIAIIVGTGTNACYVEKQTKAELFDAQNFGSNQVIINTEWGAFGDEGQLEEYRTAYDRTVDEFSANPGKQRFEKMISGMYLGEIVRLILIDLTQEGILFGGKGSQLLMKRWEFRTEYISHIESDPPDKYSQCKVILEDRLGMQPSVDDLTHVRTICEIVSKRAAYLVGMGIATLVNRIDDEEIAIGIDGSVYKYHPHFHNLIAEIVPKFTDGKKDVSLILAEDGSGRGAAMIAAVVLQRRLEFERKRTS